MEVLPFTSDPSQTFDVALGGTTYSVAARFNDENGVWTFDLTVTTGGVGLVVGVPILIGQDILGPYALGIGGMLAADLSGAGLDAGADDLGERVTVTWLTAEELAILASTGVSL